ncbi:hypothetical protein H4219_000756 [Mycoemilia scoparia]|uniref:Uncharacterized protein n=1 Tax=Mycoemilia scoparia TaxID=417184 RepID=A0A9W8A866_9FUNG|nr:hypothetical protein H4219_000756 [Mycoemilia scoparia]
MIVSNSAGTNDDKDYKHSIEIEKSLGVEVLRHQVKKPSCGDEIIKVFKDRGVASSEIASVGDRLLTDVLMGNMNGFYTIWTRQIITEKGDNPVAAKVRNIEHFIYKCISKLGVSPPSHPNRDK